MKHKAFTLIELIFVIVILGILAAIAIPKMVATRDDARIVVLAQSIGTAAQDIANYAMAHAGVEDNLSKMSSTIASLEKRGIATLSSKEAVIKAGNVGNCLTLKVISSATEDNLTIEYNNPNGDPLCTQLQRTIPAEVYPMRLRGTNVVY